MAKRYILQSEIERVRAKHPPLELLLPEVLAEDLDDAGKPRVLFPQEVALVASAQCFPDDVVMFASSDPVRAASLLLGAKYEHFKAAGGSATVLFQIVEEHSRADLGESSPSSAG